jgi:hypothetical protein
MRAARSTPSRDGASHGLNRVCRRREQGSPSSNPRWEPDALIGPARFYATGARVTAISVISEGDSGRRGSVPASVPFCGEFGAQRLVFGFEGFEARA